MSRFSSGEATLIGASVFFTSITLLAILMYLFPEPPPPSNEHSFFKDLGVMLFCTTIIGSLTYTALKIIERNKRKKVTVNFAKMLKRIAEKEKNSAK